MLETILKVAEIIFILLGLVMFCFLLSFFVDWLSEKIQNIIHHQSKIRCLCKHEYTEDLSFQIGSHIEYTLRCRKCGKVTKINIYDDK